MKKTVILLLATVFACVVAFTLCTSALVAPVSAFAPTLKIVIDAGHGGIDAGVLGITTKIKESEINLSVTGYLKTQLEDSGFEVTLTRKTDSGLYGTTEKGFKRRDMLKRKEIITETAPAIVISVHQNFYPASGSRGGQLFYKSGSEEGKLLATCIQERFNESYQRRNVKARTVSTGNYFMLECSPYPSVIAECGFLSNVKDETLLSSADFQKEIASDITAGVLEFLSKSNISTSA